METDEGRRIIKFMRRAKLRRARYYQRLLRLVVLVRIEQQQATRLVIGEEKDDCTVANNIQEFTDLPELIPQSC